MGINTMRKSSIFFTPPVLPYDLINGSPAIYNIPKLVVHVFITVKTGFTGHSRKSGNVPIMSNYSLYAIYKYKMYVHYSIMGKIRLSFVDSDLLYRVAIKVGFNNDTNIITSFYFANLKSCVNMIMTLCYTSKQ